GVCNPGNTRCTADTLETCGTNAQWTSAACPFVCRGGACTGQCKPGALRCDQKEARLAQLCNDQGEWVNNAVCMYVCAEGICGVCAPGARQCAATATQVCSPSGQWLPAGSCPNGCTDAGICVGGRDGGG